MIPWAFTLLAVCAAGATLVTLVRVRRPCSLAFPFMMAGWLTGEHAVFHLVAQVAATAAFVLGGALDAPAGWVGLALMVASWVGLVLAEMRTREARPAFAAAMDEGLGTGWRDRLDPKMTTLVPQAGAPRMLRNPFGYDDSRLRIVRDVGYGDHGRRNRLDLFIPTAVSPPFPVIVQVHGGAWVIGRKEWQGQPLLHTLAAQGWLCVAINYRLSPRATWPDHLDDVKRAIAWVHEHAAEYGGDPSFLAVVGESAGGHLAALTALTTDGAGALAGPTAPDTSVSACVTFYAPFDLTDRDGLRGTASLQRLVGHLVMRSSLAEARAQWEDASPLYRIRPDAPPFLVIQGTHDLLVYREEARRFADELRSVSRAPVVYAEIPGAQHAFDVTKSTRSLEAVRTVAEFLNYVRSTQSATRTSTTP